MYALFYRNVTDPEIVYDIDDNKIIYGNARKIKVVSEKKCIIDGLPYSLAITPRWQTLVGRANGRDDVASNYRIFCADYASSDFQSVRDAPWLETNDDAELAIHNQTDFFLVLEKSEFCDHFSGTQYYNTSPSFDLAVYEKRAKFFTDPFGVLVAFGATTFAPNLMQTRAGKFISDPLTLAHWTTLQVGSLLCSHALGKVFYGLPDSDHFKRFSGVGLLLAPLNYGHWHAQNMPALFALKQLLERGLFSEEEVTVVTTRPEAANIDLLDHCLRRLQLKPKFFDPAKGDIGAFSFDCTLLPSSSSCGVFHWSRFLARSLSLLREGVEGQDRVLFISRTDAGNSRGLSNEDEILAALAAAGIPVERVAAAELSYAEQRACFAQARLVIGSHGSGLTNALYGGPQCAVLELISDAVDGNRGWYHNLYRLLGQRYAAINCPSPGLAWSRAAFRAEPGLVVTAAKELLSSGTVSEHQRARHGAKADTTMGHITITAVGGQAKWG